MCECVHTHKKISVHIHVNIKCRQIVCHAALLSSAPLFASMPVDETEAKSVTETADTGTTLRTCLNFCLSGFHVFRFVFMFFGVAIVVFGIMPVCRRSPVCLTTKIT